MKEISFMNVRLVREKVEEYEGLNKKKIDEPTIVMDILTRVIRLQDSPVECFYILCLDNKNQINGIFEVSRGILNMSLVHPREVFQRAILSNANAIILAHNHPSGDPKPSNEDVTITDRLKRSGELLGIRVLDHIIIGEEDKWISFKEKNLI